MTGEPETFIVICRADKISRRKGPYVLTTRGVFGDRETAERYAKTINASRYPIVVAGRWRSLRFDEAS